ncbi:MAG TPA: DUF72 domain-containing protein [Polyangiaceae bacterium]|nr:DUF72 domain-containing protein [Polyangiaceae bacterium]
MSNRWHIGAKQLRGAIVAYAKRFDLLEVRAVGSASGAPGANDRARGKAVAPHPARGEELAPALPTLRRWRKSVPPHFQFSVVAGPNLARVRPSEDADRELDAARAAIDALQARCFVLRTPPEVTPTSLWRDRIAKLIRRFPRDATHFVWEPSGVWEVADAAAQANEWNVVLAVDPSREPVPAGAVAYVRLRALGETTSFGASSLERIANAVGPRREVFAIVETDSAQGEAKQLRRLLRRAAADAGGGGGKLVRPRRGIVVGDDEQE